MRFENKTFENENIRLDSNDFINCTFKKCTLTYGGTGGVTMGNNDFIDVKWTFVDAAANTIIFMAALYQGAGEGGKQVIETTFQNIRSGKIKDKENKESVGRKLPL